MSAISHAFSAGQAVRLGVDEHEGASCPHHPRVSFPDVARPTGCAVRTLHCWRVYRLNSSTVVSPRWIDRNDAHLGDVASIPLAPPLAQSLFELTDPLTPKFVPAHATIR